MGYLPFVDKKGFEPFNFGCKPSAFPIKLQAHLYRVKDLNLLRLDVSQVFYQLNYHGICGKSRIRTHTPIKANCFQDSLRYPESFGLSFHCPTGWSRTNYLSCIRRMLNLLSFRRIYCPTDRSRTYIVSVKSRKHCAVMLRWSSESRRTRTCT